MTVRIVGGGFSGLTLAWYLCKQGLQVEIFDRGNPQSGLIETLETEFGPVETAANAILNSHRLEELVDELGLSQSVQRPLSSARSRFIFHKKMRRWPLGLAATFRVLWFILRFLYNRKQFKPIRREPISAWGKRCLGEEATERLVQPALQGIYGSQTENLSASLILGRFFSDAKPASRPRFSGSMSFAGGMGQFLSELRKQLRERNCRFVDSEIETLSEWRSRGPVVLAVSAADAAKLLQHEEPGLSRALQAIQVRPLVSATLFFSSVPKISKGFGCLFPSRGEFSSLGVLFNSWIFPKRCKGLARHSETWILPIEPVGIEPAMRAGEVANRVVETINRDRQLAFGASDTPIGSKVTFWRQALPAYSVELETLIEELKEPKNLYLHGNYLGVIGLSRILERSYELASRIKRECAS